MQNVMVLPETALSFTYDGASMRRTGIGEIAEV